MRGFASLIVLALAVGQINAPGVLSFIDYPVTDLFTGIPVPPVLSSREARMFRTELRRQAATGPNFAGHFTFVRFGCGAGCVTGAVVDARSGRVWFPRFRVEDALERDGRVSVHHSVDFRLDSELVVACGRINEGETGTAYFRWNEGRLTLLQLKKGKACLEAPNPKAAEHAAAADERREDRGRVSIEFAARG